MSSDRKRGNPLESRTDRRDSGTDFRRRDVRTHDSLMGTKMKSFWNRSTCRVHVFTLLCFLFWILTNTKQRLKHSAAGATCERVTWRVGVLCETHGRLVVSRTLRRSRWFSLL